MLEVLMFVPPRIQRAVGRTVACDEPNAQPAWRARGGPHHRAPGREQGAAG
jgi:hypothetical protein